MYFSSLYTTLCYAHCNVLYVHGVATSMSLLIHCHDRVCQLRFLMIEACQDVAIVLVCLLKALPVL